MDKPDTIFCLISSESLSVWKQYFISSQKALIKEP